MVVLRKRRGGVAAVATAAFPAGTLVEVQPPDDDGFNGAWYEATVTESHPRRSTFDVVYASLLSDSDPSKPLRETDIPASNVRPRPPRNWDERYELYQLVDVYHHDGWWLGVVAGGELSKSCAVAFPASRQVVEFCPVDMRPHREWRVDEWVSAAAVSQTGAMFEVEEHVEVSRDEEHYGSAWFEGKVIKVIQKTTFLVEYKMLKEDGSPNMLREILDAQYLRPIPPPTPNNKTFTLLEGVEVCHCGGWMAGVVLKVVAGLIPKYVVELINGKDEVEVNHIDMRLHREWNHGMWKRRYKRRGGPSLDDRTTDLLIFVPPSPVDTDEANKISLKCKVGERQSSDDGSVDHVQPSFVGTAPDLHISDSPSSVQVSAIEQTNKMKQMFRMGERPCRNDLSEDHAQLSFDSRTPDLHISDTPSSVKVSAVELTNKVTLMCKMGERPRRNDFSEHCGRTFVSGKASDLPDSVRPLSSSGPTEQTNKMSLKRKLGEGPSIEGQVQAFQPIKQLKKAVPPNQFQIDPKTPVVELEVPAATEGYESPPNESVVVDKSEKLACQSDPAPIESSVKTLLFVKSSVLWENIEAMEVFRRLPQEPSFRQLAQYSSVEIREGMAVGLMLSFANLADSIKKLNIFGPQASFDEKLEALITLEENGFDVQRIRSCIEELLKIRNDRRQFASKGTGIEDKILARQNEIEQLEATNYTLDKTIMEVEQNLAQLREERKSVDAQVVNHASELAKLKKDVHETEEACLLSEQRFDIVLDSSW